MSNCPFIKDNNSNVGNNSWGYTVNNLGYNSLNSRNTQFINAQSNNNISGSSNFVKPSSINEWSANNLGYTANQN